MSLHLELQRPCAGGPAEAELRRWAELVLRQEGRAAAELTVRIVDETESAELNRRYRGKHGPTNVLSFTYDVPAEVESGLLGDLVICAPVVAREARAQGKPEQAHWAHMLVHGMLHLLGYDHIDAAEARQMEQREIALLAQLGFADPYSVIE